MTSIYAQLQPLFFPRSAAVVGVSQDTWKPGSSMLRALIRFGFSGPLYPVSSRGGELMGLKVYPSIAELPEAVDLAFLFVPTEALIPVVRQCKEKGVRGVVAFTGGFSETGTPEGRALEQELKKEFDGTFRMVGPNCLGIYSPGGGVTQHPGEGYSRESGDVALVAQSGGLSEDFSRAAPNFGFHCSKVVSYGNACDVNEADLLEYMGADPATNVVGMYIEGPRDGKRLARVLRDVAARKPVVVWKSGLTPLGAAAASSHTGSLAGSVEVWAALLRQVGAVQVGSFEELLDTLAAFHFLPGLTDRRIGYVGAGGGNTVVAGDASYMVDLPLPRLSPETQRRMAAFVPPVGASVVNPVDMLAPMPSAQELKGLLDAMADSGEVGTVIVDRIVLSKELRALMNYSLQSPTEDEPWLSEVPIDLHRSGRVRVVVVLREYLDPNGDPAVEVERLRLRDHYQRDGIAVFPTAERAFRALGHVIDHHSRKSRASAEQDNAAGRVGGASGAGPAKAVIEAALAEGRNSLSEHEAKRVLAAYAIPVTAERLVRTAEELDEALHEFESPVVLKIDSPHILHKTEAGLVTLDCRTAEEAQAEMRRILRVAAERFPQAVVNGVLVQERVSGAVAECIVGMKRDPQFGPTVLFGLGGIFVEVFEDVALRVAPLSAADAAEMIRETQGFKLLAGARGRPKADAAAIENVLLKMSRLALDLEPYLLEIDINPLMVGAQGTRGGRAAVAVDALMLLDRTEGGSSGERP
jgi:acetyltransferase